MSFVTRFVSKIGDLTRLQACEFVCSLRKEGEKLHLDRLEVDQICGLGMPHQRDVSERGILGC